MNIHLYYNKIIFNLFKKEKKHPFPKCMGETHSYASTNNNLLSSMTSHFSKISRSVFN